MGSTQSVPSTTEINDVSRQRSIAAVGNSQSARRGQETTKTNENSTKVSNIAVDLTEKLSVSSTEVVDDDDNESVVSTTDSEEYDSDDEEQLDEEYESFIAERRAILADAAALKMTAEFFLQPEKTVTVSDPFATARCFFDRPSAPEPLDEEECDLVMDDVKSLKVTAEWFYKPEAPVQVTDPTVFGRNYFTRPSAAEQVDEDLAEEEERILVDLQALKKVAGWYMHPQAPVEVDATACGRNYFNRASAPINEGERERQQILAEAAELKKVAEWYHCPEKPVGVDDTACGRNYFTRASAPDSAEDDLERQQVLADALALKKVAGWYMHPEAPLEVDVSACARNYFSNPSAPEYEEEDDMDEREQILADMAELKKVAEWYHCPEKPVEIDSTACGRNYFNRASAPINEGERERQQVLADAMSLKKVAEWYHCPEKPVEVDATACGRNYFTRASAPDSAEEDAERQQVLADALALKKVAGWYMHPEAPLEIDSAAFARNFYSRSSAPEYEEEDDMDEREQVLADMAELKKVAGWYMHPEAPVEVDATACARNFFSRPSAPTNEEEEERQQSLAEAAELKKIAGWYMRPEAPVSSNVAVTRNYFTRPGAPLDEEDEERQQVLDEMAQLKKLAVDYLHPENPVDSSINCVRNYFDRASAQGHLEQIHTEGHAISKHGGYLEVHHFDDHHHYHEYDYGHHHDDHSMQSDHFEMEEDQLHGFRDSMLAYQQEHDKQVPIITEGNEKEGGNLSRSPSDVMLFSEEDVM